MKIKQIAIILIIGAIAFTAIPVLADNGQGDTDSIRIVNKSRLSANS